MQKRKNDEHMWDQISVTARECIPDTNQVGTETDVYVRLSVSV